MTREHQMGRAEALSVTQALVEMWPQPELEANGIMLLATAVADTGLTLAEAQRGVRQLMQQDHRFRPNAHQLRAAAFAGTPAYHQPFTAELATPPAPPEVRADGLAEMRRLLRGGS